MKERLEPLLDLNSDMLIIPGSYTVTENKLYWNKTTAISNG